MLVIPVLSGSCAESVLTSAPPGGVLDDKHP
jgi:hypothetical protein